MKKKIRFENIGCRTNVAEIEKWLTTINHSIYEISTNCDFDIAVLNTCCVTQKAEAKCKSKIKQLMQENPEAQIYVTGCFADIQPMQSDKNVQYIKNCDKELFEKKFSQDLAHFEFSSNYLFKTRHNVVIQKGCDAYCSYCIVPYVRGNEESRSFDEVIEYIAKALNSGINEIILTGTNIGRYNSAGKNLPELVKEILKSAVGKNFRLRLSSVEAADFQLDLVNTAIEDDRLCPFFHIPTQSLSDEILKKMKRKYSSTFYLDLVNKIKEKMPNALIGTDIITGFPNENTLLFDQTYENLKNSSVDHFHVFPFSAREKTEAYNFKGVISNNEKRLRVNKIIELGKEKKKRFLNNLKQNYFSFIPEKIAGNRMHGKTENFVDAVVQIKGENWRQYEGNLLKIKKMSINDNLSINAEIVL